MEMGWAYAQGEPERETWYRSIRNRESSEKRSRRKPRKVWNEDIRQYEG